MSPSLIRGTFFTRKASLESKGLPIVVGGGKQKTSSRHPGVAATCSIWFHSEAKPVWFVSPDQPQRECFQTQKWPPISHKAREAHCLGESKNLASQTYLRSRTLTKSGMVGTHTISHTLLSSIARGVWQAEGVSGEVEEKEKKALTKCTDFPRHNLSG